MENTVLTDPISDASLISPLYFFTRALIPPMQNDLEKNLSSVVLWLSLLRTFYVTVHYLI